ncbi:MAG TPA: 3-dehydroquinate synthase family protein [Cyclobacteriaceae bacterium]
MTNFKIEGKEIYYSLDDLVSDQIKIISTPFNYSVRFVDEKDLAEILVTIKKKNKDKHFVFIDHIVNKLYSKTIFKNQKTFPLIVKETNKTLPTVTKVLDELQRRNITKKEIFLSAGGGITQDVSSFTRAVFKRGINWTYLPTTLLAMADSCIGAKACLNYDGIKNLLGLFSAPSEIFIYPGFLNSLDHRDILSGYGEIIKLSIVGGQGSIDAFNKIKSKQDGNLVKGIDQMIKLSLLIKKSVIEIDEYEYNIRKALNYGHTVGHAIEPLVNYKIPHGISVSLGMVIENKIAREFGDLPTKDCEIMNNLIAPFIDKASLNHLKGVSAKSIIKNMKRDKKTLDNDIYMAVPSAIGNFNMLKVSSDISFEKFLSKTIKEVMNS